MNVKVYEKMWSLILEPTFIHLFLKLFYIIFNYERLNETLPLKMFVEYEREKERKNVKMYEKMCSMKKNNNIHGFNNIKIYFFKNSQIPDFF